MNKPELNNNYDPRQFAFEVLERSNNVLRSAVAIVSPESPDANPLDVFLAPGEVRANDPSFKGTADQEEKLRDSAAELGFGSETDRTMSELGLQGGAVILEGGQAHKIQAEALVVAEDESANPSSIIFSASPNRKISNDEQQFMAEFLGTDKLSVGATEYEIAAQIASKITGFEKSETDVQIPYNYNIDNKFIVTSGSNNQLTIIGKVGAAPVILLRVDRENYTGENGKTKYRNQPDSADIIRIVDTLLRIDNDESTPIAFVTSGTYRTSREVDGARAALAIANRKVGVPTYGTALMARVKGNPLLATGGPINQLPGELHMMAVKVQKLKEEIENL